MSQPIISSVKRKISPQRNSIEKIKFSRQQSVSTSSTVSTVIQRIDVKDSPTQRSIAQSSHVSQPIVFRIIKSANFILRKKCKVHKLTASNVEKRRQCTLRLYRQFDNHPYKNFVTIYQSWFHLNGTVGKRKFCYV
jgi:hypothetical protein